MSAPPVRRVAVVGGGIAGLTLAVALRGQVEVVVHEAEPDRGGSGSSLVLWPSARRTLARLGVLDRLGSVPSPVGAGRLFDITGRPLTRAHDAGLVAVPRPALLRALTGSLPASVRLVRDEVTDPGGLDADLVVGADGVRSRVRGLVDPGAADRLPTPWVALRGTTATPPERARVGEYWGPGPLLGLVGTVDGGYWFTSHPSTAAPEPLDVGTVLAQARRLAARSGAAPAVREVLDGAGDDTSATRIRVAPPLRRYVRDRVVVIGDAAHAMTPNLGRGACDAVLDAATLGRALTSGLPLPVWQARRPPPTRAARTASGTVMRLALAGRGRGARDAALRIGLAAGGPPGDRG